MFRIYMDLRNGKDLLDILKPKNGKTPHFRDIPYDDMILIII